MKFRTVLFLSISLVFVSCSHRADKIFEFEKVEYHHIRANDGGSSSTYHLSIDAMGKINLYSEGTWLVFSDRLKIDFIS